jgi:uncharacterized protein
VALVLDTGVVYAALDTADPDHPTCADLIQSTREPLVIPSPVLVELDYWLGKYAGPEAWLTLCEDIDAGAYTLFELSPAAVLAAAQLEAKYADQPIGFVDAAVAVTCHALGETKVATLDRRHFSVIKTADGRPLALLPH